MTNIIKNPTYWRLLFASLLVLVFISTTINALAIIRTNKNKTNNIIDNGSLVTPTVSFPKNTPWPQTFELTQLAREIEVDPSRLTWQKMSGKPNENIWFITLKFQDGSPAHISWDRLVKYGIHTVIYWDGKANVKTTSSGNVVLPYEVGNATLFH